jgi:tubulin-specific chaperone D
LKNVIPQLVAAYLESRGSHAVTRLQPGHVTVQYAICKILYTFCKVRGEKVVVGFFNNEPRYLEPLLSDFERGSKEPSNSSDGPSPTSLSWEGRYILLLWLSHLMLSPFDLATMSSVDLSQGIVVDEQLQLPQDTPGIALRVIPICLKYIETATRERSAASQLLVRLCLRPDMRKVGLLDAVAEWAIDFLGTSANEAEIHKSLGVLSFISGLVASGNQREIGSFIAPIFEATQRLATDENATTVKSSAVARKLFVKIFRNIVTLCLQAPPDGVDTTSITEEVIGVLLDTLADGDTPVRFAASKALSMVTLKVEPNMAAEIVDAILGCLNEDVLWDEGSSQPAMEKSSGQRSNTEGKEPSWGSLEAKGQRSSTSNRNLHAVNPLRWHGLTLTLSHLLYRQAVSSEQLPDILNALLLALTFEQRSSTGASTGSNVRDAANFGIWAVARRYTTQQLQKVEAGSIRAIRDSKHKVSITQMLANELLQSACLDPAGNIRRGSSAVLQELVGRHPDTVVEGIALIQVIDFHAVGLRRRAITEVAISAAKLSPMYWESLFEGLLGWRGIGAVDAGSRIAIGRAMGALSLMTDFRTAGSGMATRLNTELKRLAARQVEERHGLMISNADIIESWVIQSTTTNPIDPERLKFELDFWALTWVLFEPPETYIPISEKAFTSPFLRPELTASATLQLFHALSLCGRHQYEPPLELMPKLIEVFSFCLGRSEEMVLDVIPKAVISFGSLVKGYGRNYLNKLVDAWLSFLTRGAKVSNARSAGRVLALGAVFGIWREESGSNSEPGLEKDMSAILDTLTLRCTTEVEIEERVTALKSLKLILVDIASQSAGHDDLLYAADQKILQKIGKAVFTALNDYTINERGDVGSLVRLEALDLVEQAWSANIAFEWDAREGTTDGVFGPFIALEHSTLEWKIAAAVTRMSLERLDKVRARAAHCAVSASPVKDLG